MALNYKSIIERKQKIPKHLVTEQYILNNSLVKKKKKQYIYLNEKETIAKFVKHR